MKSIKLILWLFFACQCPAQISDFKSINFKKADSIALAYKGEELTHLPDLSYKLTSSLNTDVERFRAIYKWVCTNIANDYSLYTKNNRKRNRFKDDTLKLKAWNTTFKKTLFKTLIKDKRTICTGYAYLLKELAQFAGLDCKIVQGYGRVSSTDIENLERPNHSWNVVKLNNKWYLCDPTWTSGIPNTETNQFTFKYNDGFFLADPQLFAINHFPVEAKWSLLNADNSSLRGFLKHPIIYGQAYKHLVLHNTPKQLHQVIKKHERITFNYQLKDTTKAKEVHFIIANGFSDWIAKPTQTTIKKTNLELEYYFKTTGFYDLHVYIGKDLISTYTIKVI